MRAPDLSAERVSSTLNTSRFGSDLRILGTAPSTQEIALDLASRGAGEGAAVIAEEQTSGRGRRGRTWHSGPGLGLWFSVVLRPRMPSSSAGVMSLWAALAVLEVLSGCLCRVEGVGLKWPNDLVAGGRKLAGILLDANSVGKDIVYAVLGVGLNTGHLPGDFPSGLATKAASVRMLTGREPDRAAVFSALMRELELTYDLMTDSEGAKALARRAREASVLDGARIRLVLEGREIEGRALEIDDQGALVMLPEGAAAPEAFRAGEVAILDAREDQP